MKVCLEISQNIRNIFGKKSRTFKAYSLFNRVVNHSLLFSELRLRRLLLIAVSTITSTIIGKLKRC